MEIKKKKQLNYGFKDNSTKQKVVGKDEVPQEQIRVSEDLLIKNFEVDYEEE